jgi:serine/threonine protein kinase
MSKSAQIQSLIEATGKFAVLSEFDEGANGYSFKAHHKHLDLQIFLKVIDCDEGTESTFAEPRALMEAVASGTCEHLVRLHDAEKLTSDYILMSMEFIEGGSLNGLIKENTLGQMDAIRLTLGILMGVGHLHKARFLHRDIKPGNMLVKSTGVGQVVKLGDFGSVRRLEVEESRVAAFKHSALYRPPEAWGTEGWFGFSSDLYQVAVCLYEMINGPLPHLFESHLDAQARKAIKLCGVKTFQELGDFERTKLVDDCLERRIKSGSLLNMVQEKPYFSPRLSRLIRKATCIEPSERYQRAFEFHSALQALSVPNWKFADSEFIAEGWRKWDWMVKSTSTKLATTWQISRARHGTKKFRAFGDITPSAKSAFKIVEDFE